MNSMYTSPMEFLCYASGNYHQNIYLTKEMDAYVCWHDLNNKGRKWHMELDKQILHDREHERHKQLPPQDLYVFDDVKLDRLD